MGDFGVPNPTLGPRFGPKPRGGPGWGRWHTANGGTEGHRLKGVRGAGRGGGGECPRVLGVFPGNGQKTPNTPLFYTWNGKGEGRGHGGVWRRGGGGGRFFVCPGGGGARGPHSIFRDYGTGVPNLGFSQGPFAQKKKKKSGLPLNTQPFPRLVERIPPPRGGKGRLTVSLCPAPHWEVGELRSKPSRGKKFKGQNQVTQLIFPPHFSGRTGAEKGHPNGDFAGKGRGARGWAPPFFYFSHRLGEPKNQGGGGTPCVAGSKTFARGWGGPGQVSFLSGGRWGDRLERAGGVFLLNPLVPCSSACQWGGERPVN